MTKKIDHPSFAKEQQEAEKETISRLNKKHGWKLVSEKFPISHGKQTVSIDGIDRKERVMVECYAHIGDLKPAQKKKPIIDAVKMFLVEKEEKRGKWKKFVVFADENVHKYFDSGSSWHGLCLEHLGIKALFQKLSLKTISRLKQAQARQGGSNKKTRKGHEALTNS